MRSLYLPTMDWVGDRRPVNIAVIGGKGHGKTSLVASILCAQNQRLGVPLPDLPRGYADPINRALYLEYMTTTGGTLVLTGTARRLLRLIDCGAGSQGLGDAVRFMALADGAILAVSCR